MFLEAAAETNKLDKCLSTSQIFNHIPMNLSISCSKDIISGSKAIKTSNFYEAA